MESKTSVVRRRRNQNRVPAIRRRRPRVGSVGCLLNDDALLISVELSNNEEAKGRRIDRILESPSLYRRGDRTTRSFLRAKLNEMAAENVDVGNDVSDVEKAKVGSSAMDPSMQMSMVSKTLAIPSFPLEVQGE